ncbi:MAG: MarR family transcriptional regulator [Desulfobulbaceae bacterium]|nr:MAG: MarR family transcriptional regulator [Desulfobulbaceae bacterium]
MENEHAVTQQLRIIFKAIQAHSKQVEKNCGLSSVRLWMLYEIDNADGIKVSELAERLSIHRSTCSNLLDKLEDRNLIYRNRSKSDQRAVRLYLTDEGKAILAQAPSPPEGKLSSSLNKLSQQQLDELHQTLAILVDALQFDDEKAALTPIQTP